MVTAENIRRPPKGFVCSDVYVDVDLDLSYPVFLRSHPWLKLFCCIKQGKLQTETKIKTSKDQRIFTTDGTGEDRIRPE